MGNLEAREKKITSVTIVGMVINVLLSIFKLVAGIFGHSAAMLADGVHSLSDFVSDIVVLFCVKISSKGVDEDHDYGHGKYETLASLCVSILLFFVSIELLLSGVNLIIDYLHGKQIDSPKYIALIMAIVSIIVKEMLFQYTAHVGKSVESSVVVANAWHHRTDALSSVASALGIAGTIFLGEKWCVLDPIVCCCISVFIFYVAVTMALPSLHELLESSLPKEIEDEMCGIIMSVDGVENVHGMKTRKSGPVIILEAHIVVKPHLSIVQAHDIATKTEKKLRKEYGSNMHVNLHVEPSEDAE